MPEVIPMPQDATIRSALLGDPKARAELIEARITDLLALARHEIQLTDEKQADAALEKMRMEAMREFDTFIVRGMACLNLQIRRMFFFHLARTVPQLWATC